MSKRNNRKLVLSSSSPQNYTNDHDHNYESCQSNQLFGMPHQLDSDIAYHDDDQLCDSDDEQYPFKHIPQMDGNESFCSTSSINFANGNLTMRDPAIFHINKNGKLEINTNAENKLPYLPLILCLNSRSLYNKQNSFCDLVKQLGLEVIMIGETFEREKYPLSELLKNTGLEIISKCRKKVNN